MFRYIEHLYYSSIICDSCTACPCEKYHSVFAVPSASFGGITQCYNLLSFKVLSAMFRVSENFYFYGIKYGNELIIIIG